MSRIGYNRRWRVVRLADPAAGTDWTLQAPGSSTWRVTSMVARFVTSAVVANRFPRFQATDGTSTWWLQPSTAVVAAGATVDYALNTGASQEALTGGIAIGPLPAAGLLLRPGHRFTVATDLIDAGDQWSRLVFMVDETPSDVPYVGDMGQIYPVDIEGT